MPGRAPDVVGEVLAYRTWGVHLPAGRHGLGQPWAPPPRLLSLNGTAWPTDDWLRAECPRRAPCIEPPGVQCSCGIYAAINRQHLTDIGYTAEWMTDYDCETLAIGEIGLAGSVIPGTLGWRASRGRVIRVWVLYAWWDLARPLGTAYRVPVGLTNTYDARS